MENNSPKLQDWKVFEQVAPYLETANLSNEYNYTLRKYLKDYLLPKEQQAGHIAKNIFHRQIKIYKLDENHHTSLVPNLILKDLQLGTNYALIETIQENKFLANLAQLAKREFNIKNLVKLEKKFDGKFTTLIADNIYTAHQNKLLKVTLKQGQEKLFDCQEEIELEAQILALKQSQTHLFAITKNALNEQKLFAIHLKEFKSIVEVLYEEAKNQTKHIDPENFSVGANVAYYIKDFQVYLLDVQSTKEPQLMKSLKDKQLEVSKIINGARHFFAVSKGRKLTFEWDTKDLVEWANKQGYQDYVNIFKSQKVTGQVLLNMDKKYMEDVLGITNAKIQQRLMVQLQQCNVENQENKIIYAWERNDKSQLGLNPSNPLSIPHKVSFPEGCKLLKCYNNITLLHNKKAGQVLMNSPQEGKLNWRPLFSQVHSIWSVSVSRDYIVLLCAVQKDEVPQQLSEAPLNLKKEKLRTAKNIIDKIQWDENVEKKDFRVGYLDKYTGILEISFDELMVTTEIKDYRIEYFKRKGEIVWSKKDRIDIL